MKLTTVVVSAIMALGVAAVPFAEAGNDVDVEARDFSGESLTEFDARSPEEEEFETRDEEDDLVARGDYNRCGYGAYEKHGKCVCKDHKLVYNEHKKRCEKPFYCKGKNVEIVDNYGEKSCKCKLEGQTYNKWKGCECKKDFEYSEKWRKCIPDCKYGEEYDGHECKKPFSCKGKNVEIVEDSYGKKSCSCKLAGQTYVEHKGCVCPHGEYFSSHWKKCVPKCEHGEEYDGHECRKPCKGKNVEYKKDSYGKGSCVCKLEHQSYDEHKGCRCDAGYTFSWKEHKCVKDCPYGEKYDHEHKRCYKPCVGDDVKLVWKNYQPECVCEKYDEVYDHEKGCTDRCPKDNDHWDAHSKRCECNRGYVSRHGKCVKPPSCPYGSSFSHKDWRCVCKDEQKIFEHGKCIDRCPGDNNYFNGHECVCKRGYESRHGKCVKKPECPYGSTFDEHAWQCVCKDKQQKFEHGRCVDRCPNAHDSWNSHSKKCVCDRGYESRHGKCEKKKSYGGY